MKQDRFPPIPDEELTPEQKSVVDTLRSGPRNNVPGPFYALLRSPDLADRVRQLGDYVRFGNSLPPALREMVILIVARFWSAQFEWFAHRKQSLVAGLDPAIADAIAVGTRPASMSADETLIFDFCTEVLRDKDVSDTTYAATMARFGERTVIDILATAGYFGFVSVVLNAKRHPVPDGSTPLAPLT